MTLRLRFTLLPVLLLLASLTAHGQTTVYGSFGATNYGYKDPTGSDAGQYLIYDDTLGLGAGVTHLFSSESHLKAGIDGRIQYSPTDRGGFATFGSLRIAFVPRHNRVSPYFQIGGGVVTMTYPIYTVTYSGFTYVETEQRQRITGGAVDFAGGFNVRLNDSWQIRPLEISSSAGSKVGSANIGFAVLYDLPHHGNARR